jgi:DNA-binding NarL/FixJ family response regulator
VGPFAFRGTAAHKRRGVAAVLLELGLPDSHGIETFDEVFSEAADLPILILADATNEPLAVEAVRRGAQDYLLPSHLDAYSLSRALRNSIERKTIEDALYLERERALSL